MNPHKLIFQYLDGEISREEDKILRDILKEDSSLSKDFQTFMEIDYEMQKSNETFAFPEDFLDSVENKILDKIASDNQIAEEKKRKRAVYFNYSVAAVPLLLLGLIISIYSINNLDFNKYFNLNNSNQSNKNYSQNSQKINLLSKENNIDFSDNKFSEKSQTSINGSIIVNKNLSNNNDKNNFSSFNTNNNHSSKSEALASNSKDIEKVQNDIALSNFIEGLSDNKKNNSGTDNNLEVKKDLDVKNIRSNISQTENNEEFTKSQFLQNSQQPTSQTLDFSAQLKELSPNKSKNLNLVNQNNNILNTNIEISGTNNHNHNIILNSFFGKDVATFGVNLGNQMLSSFSQSFASEIDQSSRIGLETGFMKFSVLSTKYVSIKSSNIGNGTLIVNNSSDVKNDELVRISGTEETNQNIFWAGVFYERNLLELDNLSLTSRLTLGASDIGFVSSLKFFGKYQLFRGVDITLGADSKLFTGSDAFLSTSKNLGSTISLIYGVRFSF